MRLLSNPLARIHFAWAVMLVATVITWHFADAGHLSFGIVFLVMALAFIKGRLVIYDFMEVRHAPLLWRLILLGWLTLVILVILLAYWLGVR